MDLNDLERIGEATAVEWRDAIYRNINHLDDATWQGEQLHAMLHFNPEHMDSDARYFYEDIFGDADSGLQQLIPVGSLLRKRDHRGALTVEFEAWFDGWRRGVGQVVS